MEVVYGVRPSYYFSWHDHEILEDHVLKLSSDEDTWLYKIEASLSKQLQHQFDSTLQNTNTSNNSCSVDTRTFTRRKHCALRPSLDTVVESDLSNCSSLGLLGASKLLNNTLQTFCTPSPETVNQEKYFLNFTVSDEKYSIPRVSQYLGRHYTFERNRLDSQSFDTSDLISLENCGPFEKNVCMTDSLLNFLEKQDDYSHSPACQQPETVKTQTPGLLLESMSSETENIPPNHCTESEKDEAVIEDISKMKSTFVVDSSKDATFSVNKECDDMEKVVLTNSINILKQYQAIKKNDLNATFTKVNPREGLNTTFTKSSDGLNGGMEDDQTSSASDSSFSSTEKPRSISELRSIAQLQESNLVLQTSTPSSAQNVSPLRLSYMDIELSPITRPRMSLVRSRPSESRSANCSPVRVPQPKSPFTCSSPRLQQPTPEVRRQTLQASSMSNITSRLASGLRLPQPVRRFNPQEGTGMRPATVPAATSTAIPRPLSSRLPTLRLRPTGIPGPKRGGARH